MPFAYLVEWGLHAKLDAEDRAQAYEDAALDHELEDGFTELRHNPLI